jgi:hypothetical protein
MSSPNSIYVGGWARFREESGATRKEVEEDFSWMGEQDIVGAQAPVKFGSESDRIYYEDCRDALGRVEGSKEWLKAYVGEEEGSDQRNFRDAMSSKIKLHPGHSGSSWCGIMWAYKALLSDWDGWVLATKERQALREYTKIQAPAYVFSRLSNLAASVQAGYGVADEGIVAYAEQWGFKGSIEEIAQMAGPIHLENQEQAEKWRMEEAENAHKSLMGGVKWKYMHPSRWFDTRDGSSIYPCTPYDITPRAIQEMTQKQPEYRQHLQRVTAAMAVYRATFKEYDTSAKMDQFLKKWSLV